MRPCRMPFADRPGATRHRVLFVDDESNVMEAIRRSLRGEPYEIVTAGSGEEALAILRKAPVDVIVSDEMMPGMSGSELLALVRRDYPGTARMILTGQGTLDAAIRAINEGEVYRFLTKPVKRADLVPAIRGALELKGAGYGRSARGPFGIAPLRDTASTPESGAVSRAGLAKPPTAQADRRRERFRLVLGGETATPAALRGLASAAPTAVRNPKSVLVADEDPRARIVYRAELENIGFVVAEARDGIEAWTQLRNRTVSCVVMDMKLSGHHGLDLLRRMRESRIDVPVVVVTVHRQLADEFAVATYPRLTFLKKPTTPGQIAFAVQAYVGPGKGAGPGSRAAATPGSGREVVPYRTPDGTCL